MLNAGLAVLHGGRQEAEPPLLVIQTDVPNVQKGSGKGATSARRRGELVYFGALARGVIARQNEDFVLVVQPGTLHAPGSPSGRSG